MSIANELSGSMAMSIVDF